MTTTTEENNNFSKMTTNTTEETNNLSLSGRVHNMAMTAIIMVMSRVARLNGYIVSAIPQSTSWLMWKLFYCVSEQLPQHEDHTHDIMNKCDKRILFSGSAGLMWFEMGVTHAIAERYAKELKENVSFEGISGGNASAFSLLMASQGYADIRKFFEIGVKEFVVVNEENECHGLHCSKEGWEMSLSSWEHAAECIRNQHHPESHHQNLSSVVEGKLVVWVTDHALRSQGLNEFPDAAYFADALAYIPGVIGKGLMCKQANRGGFALDGCFAQMVGDNKMYQPQTENGRTLYIEMMPTVPAPPQQDNLYTFQIWKWGGFRWKELQSGLCEEETALSQFDRGYAAAQEHMEEVENAMQWLLAANDANANDDNKSSTTDDTSDDKPFFDKSYSQIV
eukprot:gene325-427_t